jgi:uncharacterized protein
MVGTWTLGLYNAYDPHNFHEAMRRAIARAAPLCRGFGFNLAPIGFPWDKFRSKSGKKLERPTPLELATHLAESTTIGAGGEYLVDLAREDRFSLLPFPERGFPARYGVPVLATEKPDKNKQIDVRELVYRTRAGESFLFVVGLGPRGVPQGLADEATHHLELTGAEFSLETATAMGALAGRLFEAKDQVERPRGPALSVDAAVVRGDSILLVKRGREPYKGTWCLPGGFVAAGEKVEAAALRELAEETGLHATLGPLVGVYSDPARDPRHHTVGIVFLANAPRGEPRAGDDAAEARFWPLAKLPPLAFDHAAIVRDVERRLKPQP